MYSFIHNKYTVCPIILLVMISSMLSLSACNPEPTTTIYKAPQTISPKELFMKAKNFYRLKQFTKAIENFEKFKALYPDDERVVKCDYYIVRCHEQSLEEWEIALKKFMKKYPKSEEGAELKFKLAIQYWDKRNFDQAIIHFEELISQFSKNESIALGALDKLRDIYRRKPDIDNVIITLERMVDSFPFAKSAPLNLVQLAMIFEKKKDYVSAYYIWLRLRNTYPDYRTTMVEEKIAYYEDDYDGDGKRNLDELQNGGNIRGRSSRGSRY